ncbi:MAG: MFS transporter [Gammaproteobacteria bacterium]|nr:MAG: MFS transporter [Gammaproteobacteria bacterium]
MMPQERRAAYSLASIYALRMLGLFMIFPVFSLYARHLAGATPVLIGLALGIYGLTQAILQIPFGWASDRLGRKPVIIAGLLLFAGGSVVAALAHTIYGVIIGRALQGSGAIAAAVMALAADLTREEQRTKVMAMIGVSIGMAFALALILGPVLDRFIGVPGIFWLTAFLALMGIAVLRLWVPNPVRSTFHRDAEAVPGQFASVLKDTQLLRLDVGILVLHLVLTASFVVVPIALSDAAGLPASRHWILYLAVLGLSVVAMVPFIILAEKRRLIKQTLAGAVILLALSEFGLALDYASVAGIALMLFLYFTAFNVLEASLPSLISRLAPPDRKGTALGVYSSSQFMGAFLGGTVGGWLYGHYGIAAVFMTCAVLAGLWWLLVLTMKPPAYLKSYVLKVENVDEAKARELAQRLRKVPGVAEAVVIVEEGLAYLKVDPQALDEQALKQLGVH